MGFNARLEPEPGRQYRGKKIRHSVLVVLAKRFQDLLGSVDSCRKCDDPCIYWES